MFDMLVEHVAIMLNQPVVIFLLIGIFAIIVWSFYVRRIKFTVYEMVNVALMLSLTVVLHEIRIYQFPQGGVVTLGGLVPLLLLTHCYGARVGTLAGFLYGIIFILQDPFILHPVQVLFDYPLPYMMVGLAVLLPGHYLASTVLVFAGKFICHFISGVAFFGAYAPEGMSPVLYSLMVNISVCIPECVICCIILKLLPVKRLIAAMKEIGQR